MSYQAIKTWRNLICILLTERSQSEKAISCLMPPIWHSGKGKTMEKIKWSVVARGYGEGGMNRFRAVKIFCMILQWWAYVTIHLFKHIEYIAPKVNPDVNYGLWVIIIFQPSFNYNKCTIMMWNVNSGGFMGVGEEGVVYVELSGFSALFAVNLQLFTKIKLIN